MTRIKEWEDESPKRNHHGNGSQQEFAPEFKFAAIQSMDGWECRLLEPGGAYKTLLMADGYHQACRIVNTLRGLLTDLEPGEAETIQRIRPKGWEAPVWMNPCPRCDTVAKPTLAVMCPECQAKTTANEKCVNKNKNPTWHEILLDDAGLL